ncbi:cold shock domain-containing protein [Dokdonia sinensis]|uniref:Cold shock domain-containing protein n=1 Tax=Dokdonia sinensis TaxID=2479847 RepID=A0A3M0G3U4_9FLAO|nr:cold shock domain-containing protein [Dokdonia sinensis]RMB59574.1 cold shock domain-containing protein [Dokdonia sinensis]
MARPQETFGKKEREKKRLKKNEEKRKRREEKKANGGEDFNEFVYVNHLGQLVDTPPDPDMKPEIEAEDIILGIPPKDETEVEDPVKTGFVEFFNSEKGFGFIKDSETPEKYFVHISSVQDGELKEGNKVSFELERGPKGLNAIKVKKVS